MIFTKVVIITSLLVIFAIGLYAVPDAFATTYTVENAQGSSSPGCEPDCFIPATLTISPGDMVTFANNDSAAHTSTSGNPGNPDGVWDSSLVMVGMSYTTPALDAGEYPYYCAVHPRMAGLVIVTDDHSSSTSSSTNSTSTSPPPQPVITFSTNKNSYQFGDAIAITGSISNYYADTATLAIYRDDGFRLLTNPTTINSDGSFGIISIKTDSVLNIPWKMGTSDYLFEITAGSYSEAKIIQLTKPDNWRQTPTWIVENAEGSMTPGCEPDCFIPNTITIYPGESV